MNIRYLTGLIATLALFGTACGTANDAATAEDLPPEAATGGGDTATDDPEPVEALDYPKALKEATAPALGVPRTRDTIVENLAASRDAGGSSIAAAYRTAHEAATALEPGERAEAHASVVAFLDRAAELGSEMDVAAAAGDLPAFVAGEVAVQTAAAQAVEAVEHDPDVCQLVSQYGGLGQVWRKLCETEAPHGDWGREVFRITRTFGFQVVPTSPHRLGLVAMYAHPASARGSVPMATDLELITSFYTASQPHVQPAHARALAALDELGATAQVQDQHAAIVTWLTQRREATERLIELAGSGASFETMAQEAVAPLTVDQGNAIAEALGSASCGLVAGLFCD